MLHYKILGSIVNTLNVASLIIFKINDGQIQYKQTGVQLFKFNNYTWNYLNIIILEIINIYW